LNLRILGRKTDRGEKKRLKNVKNKYKKGVALAAAPPPTVVDHRAGNHPRPLPSPEKKKLPAQL